MDTRVFTHSLHGGVDIRSDDVLNRGSLLACAGRVVAIAQGSAIDFYDASDVSNTSNILGDGSCKLHFICTAPITDIAAPVTVLSVAFLHGGLLAVCGSCSRGTVVHAYKLAFTSTNADKRPFSTDVAYAAAPSLATHALPRLVFRAALPQGSVVHLLPHPTVLHTLAVLVEGDNAVRFYDCTPASDAVVPALLDCTAGVVQHPTDSPLARACISRDGQVLALATEGREVALYRLFYAPMQVPGTSRTLTSGQHHLSYVYDQARVSALTLMRVPAPGEASRHTRFALNGYALVTGHMDGTMNVWWPGNVSDLQQPASVGAHAGGEEAVYRVVRSGSQGAPLAAYPAFHASRGPILHLSPAVAAEEGLETSPGALPSILQRLAGGHNSTDSASTSTSASAYSAVCVGAHGARGWRVLVFPHKPIQPAAAVHASVARMKKPQAVTMAGTGTGTARGGGGGGKAGLVLSPSSTLSSPSLGARWGYDTAGHRVLLPAPAEDVSHLLTPYFSCPTFTDVVSSPVIGEADGLTYSSPSTAGGTLARPSLLLQAPIMTGPGIEPRGAFILQRYPCRDGALLCEGAQGGKDVVTGSVHDAGLDTRKLFPGLPPSSLALDKSIFSLLARDYGGNVHVEGMATTSLGSGTGTGGGPAGGCPPRPGETFSFTAAEDVGPARAGVGASFKYIPRTVVLLLTERGLHVTGLDYHPALHAPQARVEAQAARALGYPALSTEHGEAALVPSSDPYFGGFAPYALPPASARGVQPPSAHVPAQAKVLQQAQEEELAESATKAVRRARKEMAAHAAARASRVARLPQHVHVSPPSLPVRPPSSTALPRPKTAWPMSITGRQDSIIRGYRAVFQEETLVGALSSAMPGEGRQAEVLHAVPAQAQRLLESTAFSSGFAQAEKVAARLVQEETARRTAAKMAYLPRHSAARLALKQQGVAASASTSNTSAGGRAGPSGSTADPSAQSIGRTLPYMNHPLQPWTRGGSNSGTGTGARSLRASSPLVPHRGGQGQAAYVAADTASVYMSIEGEDEVQQEGEEAAGLLAQLASMKAHLAAVQVEFREQTRQLLVATGQL